MIVFNPAISLWLPMVAVVIVLWGRRWQPIPQGMRWALKLGLVGLGLRYGYWRTTATLALGDGATAIVGWGLYGLELVVWLSLLLYTVQTLFSDDDRGLQQLGDHCETRLREQPELPQVDLLILVDQQPEARVRRAMMACQSLRYERQRIYVLDLDDRAGMRSLVESLGGVYVAAPVPEWSPALLLNSALRQSEGELIAVLTAGMMPLPQFLERTVGWFTQSAIAWVQTPVPGLPDDRQVHCESAYVVRRSRLEMIGGYFTAGCLPGYQTLLRLVLHGETWVSLPESLISGDRTELPQRGLNRRLQWLQGNWEIQQLPLAFPLSSRLGWPQRLCLANQWLHGWQPLWQLGSWLVPIVALSLGIMPIHATGTDWVAYLGPFWLLNLGLTGGCGGWTPLGPFTIGDWRGPITAAMTCGPGLQRLGQLLTQTLLPHWGKGPHWQSEAQALVWGTIDGLPSLRAYTARQRWGWFSGMWVMLSLGAIGWDWARGDSSGWAARWPLYLWAGYNAVMLTLAQRSLRQSSAASTITPQPLYFPCRFWVAGEKWPGRTLELSEQGARIQLLPQSFPLESMPELLTIEFGQPILQVTGRVVEIRRDQGGQQTIQITFQGLTLDQERQLLWLLYPPESGATPRPLRPWAIHRR